MIDLHTHILPDLDDGAHSWEESLEMAKLAKEDGIDEIICTPHWLIGLYDNTREIVLERVKSFRELLLKKSIPLKIYPGSELRIEAGLLQKIHDKQVLTLNDTHRYALIELPNDLLPPNLDSFFWEMQKAKVTPIIAHPERNLALIEAPENIYNWVNMGIVSQITSASILGYFGKSVQKFSFNLLKHNLVHLLATDSHGIKNRPFNLSKGYKIIADMKGSNEAKQMVIERPKQIISGQKVSFPDPVPLSQDRGRFKKKKFFDFFLKSLLLGLFFIAGCAVQNSPFREVTPAERTPTKECDLWGCTTVPYIQPIKFNQREKRAQKKEDSSQNNTQESSEISEKNYIKSIDKKKITQQTQNRLIQIQKKSFTTKEYFLNKFNAQKIVFPEELQASQDKKQAYKIGPYDLLYVFVYQNPDLSLEAVVRYDGFVSLPLIGEVKAAGMGIPRFENQLEKRYADYLENSQVTVTVKEANSLEVFITGAVDTSEMTQTKSRSGFMLRGDRHLLTALSSVEILPEADMSESYIVRGETIIPIDLNRLLEDGDMTQNVQLEPSDTIVIPYRSKEVTVLGEVDNPGRHKVKRQTTVMDALAAAGGVKTETAALNLAYMARNGNIVPINFQRLIEYGDLDQNILIHDGDVIYIPSGQDNKLFVLGEVRRPQVIEPNEPISLVEAISYAGGLEDRANREQIVVIRGGVSDSKMYVANLDQVLSGLLHKSFMLHHRDIVYVPRTWIGDWNVFINQIFPTIQSVYQLDRFIDNQ